MAVGGVEHVHGPVPARKDAKGAVSAHTRGWARDLGPKAIAVNLVEPGPIDTDMNPANGDFAAEQNAGVPLGNDSACGGDVFV